MLDPLLRFDGTDPTPRALAEVPDGSYWFDGAQPAHGDGSITVRLCAGTQSDVQGCFEVDTADTGTTPTTTPDDGQDPSEGCAPRTEAAGVHASIPAVCGAGAAGGAPTLRRERTVDKTAVDPTTGFRRFYRNPILHPAIGCIQRV